jgi:hypothetical protein
MTDILFPLTAKVVALLMVVVCVVNSAPAQPKRNRFDPDGSFWIKGDHPDGFSDFGGINLNAKRDKHLPNAGLDLNNGRHFRFKELSVSREKLTFTTVVLSNISYSFSGRFLKGGVYGAGNLDDETPVLEGTLIKYRNGKKIAEAKLSFVYFGGT